MTKVSTAAGSEQCKPKPDYRSIGTTSGNSDSLGSHFTFPVTCDFAVKSAVAAGTTANLACKALATLTLNELAERYRAQPATSDFALPEGVLEDADAMHVIELCETTCYEYGVGPCFDEPASSTLILAVGLIAVVLMVVCVLKKKKRCCFRAKTVLGEQAGEVAQPATVVTVSMADSPAGTTPYARQLE